MLKIHTRFIILCCIILCNPAFTMKQEYKDNNISESEILDKEPTESLKIIAKTIQDYVLFRKNHCTVLKNDDVIIDIENCLKKGANPNVYLKSSDEIPFWQKLLYYGVNFMSKKLLEEEKKRIESIIKIFFVHGADVKVIKRGRTTYDDEVKYLLNILATMICRHN